MQTHQCYCTILLAAPSFDLLLNLKLQPQRLQKALRVGELLPLEFRFTLQPARRKEKKYLQIHCMFSINLKQLCRRAEKQQV